MATKLTRSVCRETKIKVSGRELLVYLDPQQRIGFKLKGLRNEPYFFNIVHAYNVLMSGDESKALTTKKKKDLTEEEVTCAETIIKDIQEDLDLPYPYQRELIKYFRKKYGTK